MAYMRKRGWAIFFLVFTFLLGAMSFRAFSEQQEETGNFRDVEMEIDSDTLMLFNQATGRIYVYNGTDGRPRAAWQIKKLGARLERFGSTGERW